MSNDKVREVMSDGFLQDIKKAQYISAATAASSVILTILVVTITPISAEAVRNVWLIGALTIIFTAIYYLVPGIYFDKRLTLFPDVVYTVAIVTIMKNLGEWGYLYIIFFLIIIALNSFVYNLKNFILSTIVILFGVLFSLLPIAISLNVFFYKLAFELYGVVALAIVLRLFATEALRYKAKKDELETLNRHLALEKYEITNLFDSISDIIISLDTKGRVILLNEKAASVFSLDKKKMVGKKLENYVNLVGQKGPFNFSEAISCQRGKSLFRNDLELIGEKETKSFFCTITPLHDENEVFQGSIIFMHDATKEEELEKKKEEFTAIASHELRTPLAVIEGYLHFLLTNNDLKYDGETKKYLNIIHESALELIKLSKDILLTTKSEAGTLELTIEKTDLLKLLKEVMKEYSSKINDKGLKVTITTKEKALEIKTDKAKLKEIVINLLDNAIKFTEKGSITISLFKTGGEAVLSIKDTGIGIAPEAQKLIFQKFYRAEDWQTRATGGSGLGLYVCKSLAERLGGQINFQSKKGEGSVFVLSLPLAFSKKKRLASNKKSNNILESLLKNF
ncbi:hypothetical protein COY62_04215 [bacterium (Candidatus Howlettbacteria) CG_4_10_14_0_8_um_filter_40_9]|nr:MAG: hypothetical protein COY62_04215 [bacterium (Candidatus Howlettbacteria) CG_4_10_14_0_8_um_filter_40_9]